jgi:3-oxoacyl-[acyl-carrier protein] reductase
MGRPKPRWNRKHHLGAGPLAGTGVTVNSLLPGGATDTGMVPESISFEVRRHLLDPEVMVAALLWLVSEKAAAVTGASLVAKLWDSSLPPLRAAEKARFTAGWAISEP